MPDLIKAAVFFIMIFSFSACSTLYKKDLKTPFFIVMEQETRNGAFYENRLFMLPADKEFRIEKWEKREVSIKTSIEKGEDGRDKALKMIWEKLLYQHGTKSIVSKEIKDKDRFYSKGILRYEGLIKEDMRLIDFKRKEEEISISLELYFAPLAFPDNWEKLEKKQRNKEIIRDFLSIFK